MKITFLETVNPPDAVTTFRKGRTFSMPEAMAMGFIVAGKAYVEGETPPDTAPQSLDDETPPNTDEPDTPPNTSATD